MRTGSALTQKDNSKLNATNTVSFLVGGAACKQKNDYSANESEYSKTETTPGDRSVAEVADVSDGTLPPRTSIYQNSRNP